MNRHDQDKLEPPSPQQLQSEISARIKEIRGKRSLRDFAEQLGIHYNSQRRYEATGDDARDPPLPYLIGLAKKEQVSLAWLLTGQQQEIVGVLAMSIAKAVFEHPETSKAPEVEQARIVNATIAFLRELGYEKGLQIPTQEILNLVGLAAKKLRR